MKKNIYFLSLTITILVLFFTNFNFAQDEPLGGRNPKVDSVINLVTTESVGVLTREISGDVEVTISGSPYTIETRYANTASNKKAKEYIKEKLSSYGIETRLDNYSETGTNVIGKITGSRYPDRQYIICCHFDDYPIYSNSTIAPGADDNGSGVVGILEAARLLANYSLDYTVLFIAFDEEEIDILGSYAYANSAYNRGDNILGVINLDMIAYDKNNDGKLEILTNRNTESFADEYISTMKLYVPSLSPLKDVTNKGVSDHIPFNKQGWKAFHVFEDSFETNPNMHSKDDNFSNCNMTYLQNIVKSVIAFVMTKASM